MREPVMEAGGASKDHGCLILVFVAIGLLAFCLFLWKGTERGWIDPDDMRKTKIEAEAKAKSDAALKVVQSAQAELRLANGKTWQVGSILELLFFEKALQERGKGVAWDVIGWTIAPRKEQLDSWDVSFAYRTLGQEYVYQWRYDAASGLILATNDLAATIHLRVAGDSPTKDQPAKKRSSKNGAK